MQVISFLGGPSKVRLSPVYDPAPMRAWPQHNSGSAIPIDFNKDIGGVLENLIAVGQSYGLSYSEASDLLHDIEKRTGSYIEQFMQLETVPLQRRECLAKVLMNERKALKLPLY